MFLHRVKHASGQNYVVGGPAQVYSFECSANKVSRFQPPGRPGVVWHTNHPLASDDFGAAYRATLAKPAGGPPGSSEVRLKSLEDRTSILRQVAECLISEQERYFRTERDEDMAPITQSQLASFLELDFIYDEHESSLAGVYKLPAGCTLTVRPGPQRGARLRPSLSSSAAAAADLNGCAEDSLRSDQNRASGGREPPVRGANRGLTPPARHAPRAPVPCPPFPFRRPPLY